MGNRNNAQRTRVRATDQVAERLELRLCAAFKELQGGGYLEEALDLSIAYPDRWRRLTEYLEFMIVRGYPTEITDLIRDL